MTVDIDIDREAEQWFQTEEVLVCKKGRIRKLKRQNAQKSGAALGVKSGALLGPEFMSRQNWSVKNTSSTEASASAKEKRCGHVFAIGSSKTAINAFIQCLVDTGANMSVIPQKTTDLMLNPINRANIEVRFKIGHHLGVLGEVEAIVRVGNQDIRGKVIVIPEFAYDLIIWTDLLA